MKLSTPTYSVQPVGDNARLFKTVDGITTAVTTAPHAVAERVRVALEWMCDRGMFTYTAAVDAQGEVCYLRRNLLSTLTQAPEQSDVQAAERPYFSPKTLAQFAVPLVLALDGAAEVVRRAVKEEVGRLLEGTEDVLVPLILEAESGERVWHLVMNDRLEQASDEDLSLLVEGDFDVRYDNLVHYYADADDDMYEHLALEFLDPRLDLDVVEKWIARHRPGI